MTEWKMTDKMSEKSKEKNRENCTKKKSRTVLADFGKGWVWIFF